MPRQAHHPLHITCFPLSIAFPCPCAGGLSGGEDKNTFWPVVHQCTDALPREKPRYCMGVGFAVDLVVCCALGVDMFDCVFPTRTAVSYND